MSMVFFSDVSDNGRLDEKYDSQYHLIFFLILISDFKSIATFS